VAGPGLTKKGSFREKEFVGHLDILKSHIVMDAPLNTMFTLVISLTIHVQHVTIVTALVLFQGNLGSEATVR
jgi:hypothetical protein